MMGKREDEQEIASDNGNNQQYNKALVWYWKTFEIDFIFNSEIKIGSICFSLL